MTNPDDHPAQPIATWAEKASKLFPGDWELIKGYPVKGKVCTGYAFPIGRYVKQVVSAFALPDYCDRYDTCRDARLLFAKSASHEQAFPIRSFRLMLLLSGHGHADSEQLLVRMRPTLPAFRQSAQSHYADLSAHVHPRRHGRPAHSRRGFFAPLR